MEGIMVYFSCNRRRIFWHRRGYIGVSHQCGLTWGIYIRLPFIAPYGWGIYGPSFRDAGSPQSVFVCDLFQPETYAVGMDELILGCVFRYLYPFVFDWGVE